MRVFLAALVLAALAPCALSAAPVVLPKFTPYQFQPLRSPAIGTWRPARPRPPVEQITDLSSSITVAKDGTVAVRETINVHSEGRSIDHGIVREFPIRYRDRDGRFVHVAFKVRSVEREGKPEPYSVGSFYGNANLLIGDAFMRLPRGDHTYILMYETDRAVGFFPQFDELYWNVTGTGWDLPIQHAEAILHMPEGMRVIAHSESAGKEGARGGHASMDQRESRLRFFTTAPLNSEEGLSFALDFNKGIVDPPSGAQWVLYWVRDNAMTSAAIVGLLAIAAYFFAAWLRFGRDPSPGVIVPVFAPPQNLSAPSLRYIRRMVYDGKCFSAALVSMAVKGYLKISDESGTFVLTRTGENAQALTAPERAVAWPLFDRGNTVYLGGDNHGQVSAAMRQLESALRHECEGTYFTTNRGWFLGGIAIFVASLASCLWFTESEFSQAFVIGWVLASIAIVVAVLRFLGGTWQTILVLIAPRLILFAAPFLFVTFQFTKLSDLLSQLAAETPWLALTVLLAQVCVAVAFYYLLKAPTAAGAKLRGAIDGFKMFLDTAEKDRLERLQSPDVTTDVFEKYLPYAIALDVENTWSKRFEAVTKRAGKTSDQAYAPDWYAGRSLSHFGGSDFAEGLSNSLAAAMASAMMAHAGLAAGGHSGGRGFLDGQGFSRGGQGSGGGRSWR